MENYGVSTSISKKDRDRGKSDLQCCRAVWKLEQIDLVWKDTLCTLTRRLQQLKCTFVFSCFLHCNVRKRSEKEKLVIKI